MKGESNHSVRTAGAIVILGRERAGLNGWCLSSLSVLVWQLGRVVVSSLTSQCYTPTMPHTPLFAVIPPPQPLPRRQHRPNLLPPVPHRGRRRQILISMTTRTRWMTSTMRATTSETIPSCSSARSLPRILLRGRRPRSNALREKSSGSCRTDSSPTRRKITSTRRRTTLSRPCIPISSSAGVPSSRLPRTPRKKATS